MKKKIIRFGQNFKGKTLQQFHVRFLIPILELEIKGTQTPGHQRETDHTLLITREKTLTTLATVSLEKSTLFHVSIITLLVAKIIRGNWFC